MIRLDNVSFDYVTFEKNPGLMGSVHDFFKRKNQKKRAIDTLNLNIPDGELIGLIGPNGAGKTTFAKLLTGIIEPTEGDIRVDNMNPALHRRSFYQNIGVMFGQKTQLSWNLPPIDTFNMLSAIYQLNDEDYKKRLNYLIKVLNLKDIIKIPVRKLSLGQRVKCELLCTLIHSPKYLFLDEPTLGLDIGTQKNIYDFLLEENRVNQTTIIFTSHNLRDIEAISKRLLILAQGHIIFDGSLNSLPVDINDHQKFKVKFLDPNNNMVAKEKVLSISELQNEIDSVGEKNIISINRQGMTIEDLVLSIYKEWDKANEKN
ncbi:ATP-binding cassette domain-containing protein [Lactobacillus sp. ESL0233]|uniref:ABC transporter ATP-binding protein n=1 Tax=Lactobacillus sp. ESL0233 TaxID=2069354 RepID=UPI000EFB67D5|nr:ATP-binding cassette domain-containing protein [Lactobacillus sp. ESL0233]RMC40110.1 ATP-binding cassette domain-containing protein [Lactobacillus sp. ESL0233]